MKVVIVGCTHAGTAAVEQILAHHPDAEVTVYERDNNISFLSCGIALYLDQRVKRLEDMFYATADDLRKLGATVKLRHDVLKIDADKKTIVAQDMESYAIVHDTYDKLIITTGSAVVVPPLQGIDHQHVLLCKDYHQAQEIYEAAKEYKNIALIGGGYVNVELAESFRRTGHDVTIYHRHDQVLNNYIDDVIADKITDQLTDHGVHFQLNHYVKGFIDDGDGLTIQTDHGDYQADIAIVSTGFVAQTDLLRGQVELSRAGAIITNEYGQTSDPDIYAAGDVRVVRFNPTDKDVYIPLASNAVRQGITVGMNIFGNTYPEMGTQGTSGLPLFDHTLATTGLTLTRALDADIDAASITFEDNYRPEFMPSTTKITVTLVYEKETLRILGGQFYSKYDVAQSANLVSLAIQNRNTLDQLAFVDMLFQPTFDRPFNYLNLAAQAGLRQEGRL